MIYVSERRGSWKSRCSKGCCMNFIVGISSKCGRKGEGVKISKIFVDLINESPLTEYQVKHLLCENLENTSDL